MPKGKKNENSESRDAARERVALEAIEGYEPQSGDVFDKSRSFVDAQLEIATELSENYSVIVTERRTSREQLRSLYDQRLLTPEEAAFMFTLYPPRTATAEAADAPAA